MKPISKYIIKNQSVIIRLTEASPLGRIEIPNATIDSIKREGIYIKIPFTSNDFYTGRAIDILWKKANFFYCLNSIVKKYIEQKSLNTLLLIEKSEKLDSIEKRSYIRLDDPLQLSFSLTNTDNDENKHNNELFSAQTVDISGGGIQFVSPIKLKKDQLIEISLEMPIFPYVDISIKGKIARVNNCNVGINFEHIGHADEKRLIKYILEKQITS